MTYRAQVLQLGEFIEEEVLLRIGDTELRCFDSVGAYPLKIGMSYPVEFTLLVVNDYFVTPVAEEAMPSFVRTGETFEYLITGKMDGKWLKVGELAFEDEVLLSNFSHLDQRMVQIKVDRIDVDFL